MRLQALAFLYSALKAHTIEQELACFLAGVEREVVYLRHGDYGLEIGLLHKSLAFILAVVEGCETFVFLPEVGLALTVIKIEVEVFAWR